ncbi:hypothetical protein [Paenibacillus amylolyticus]|uniref:hypothetical protein n=1 Tax=Paenibacillus amylolyticus TaxID=1451 RepID=UPI000FD8673F|nr:hypothetical protein [Paenibacillus amylolyticus]
MKEYNLSHEEALALIAKVHEILSGPYPTSDEIFNIRYISILHHFQQALHNKVRDLPPAP